MRVDSRRHLLEGVLLVGVLCVVILLVGRLAAGYRYGSPGTVDFIQYWTAGRLVLEGQSPYEADRICPRQREVGVHEGWCIRMWNPPWLVVWLMPVLALPFHLSAVAWMMVSLALIFLAAELVRRSATPRAPHWVTLASVLPFAPTYFTVKHGQVSALLLLGVAGFLHSVRHERPVRAGAFLALATIKPHVLHLVGGAALWWTLVERRFRVLVGPSLVLVPTLVVLTLLWPGWWSGYLAALEQPPLYWKAPVAGTLLRLLFGPELRWLQFAPTVLALSALLVWLLHRRPTLRWSEVMAPLLLLSVPTAPYGWSFDQLVLLVPQLQLVSLAVAGARDRRRLVVLVALGVILAAQVTLSSLRQEELFQLWMPWALGALFLWARRSG